ncbi:hypothetical protein ACM01_01360 [Streptomyces viridochromogenes]|uniref:Carrier domain-containing protein n=1 Tax=Streptomyces viridochromogenes TaxID=1938 RepID=A0A0J7ZQ73_STRVR|nr:non-ribosomal peptide synthetase [Streptomyces viridochromogenes]KMS77308.1 hypothetical protein ACM01_01360 [Streptomyces viridochromogenes]KOG19031.1 hypothetical protein ADK36_20490 [Streptomyces viridochromogenes]KOG19270.1 hypothetical protein ADK35_20350 [Streptomyces viridochromogenes]
MPELVHERVAVHARRAPDAVALRFEGTDTSYGDLVDGARRSARFLAGRGVRRGDVVAVRADCVPDTVRLLLGVLWCGAAYAMVPPDWPPGRFERIAGLDALRLCVADRDLPAVPGLETITLDEALGRSAPPTRKDDVRPVGEEADGSDALCVFFTSGSTGTPKGVVAPHRGILRLAGDDACTVPGRMVTYQAASSAWDAFAWELWTPLVRGGACVLSGGARPTGPRVRAAVARGANAMILNTVVFNALVDDDIDCFAGVELLVTGGERHSVSHLTRCRERHPGIRLQHGYGPAENSTYTTMHRVTAEDGAEIPIGRPVAGTDVWLLDEQHGPVPDGATGEIVIGGAGLALGYLGMPAETERCFPVLRLDERPRRVYLTGDLARRDAHGRLVFVGRRDRQVKIRGVRIEPAEIEAAIERMEGVRRAAVVALTDATGRATGLGAVVSAEGGTRPSAETVTKTVAHTFPPAFVPRHVLVVDRIPRLPNDKVDYDAVRALLPAAAAPVAVPGTGAGPAHGGGGDGQAGPLHTALSVAEALLGRPVHPDEDLFDGGATSMTAIRLATRLCRELGRPVTEEDVLECRSVGALLDRLAV